MKTNLIKLLLDVQNREFADIVYTFLIKKIGILKRDFLQNKSFNKKNGVYLSTINCMKFLLKNLNMEKKCNILYLENLENIFDLKDQILYDFEICHYKFKESLLCTFMLFNNKQNSVVIIDIINMFTTCITSKKIINIDFGIKNTSHYFQEQKIYSLIFNLIRFKKIKEYKQSKYFEFFNKNFRPLYEKTYIQTG